jgi:tryptophan halogenase
MKKRNIDNITVLGGGTAGWLTALYVKKVFPNKNITLVESSEIGILGAGEGSLPNLIRLLDVLDIPVSSLVEHTGTTLKNGVKFTNWNGGGEKDFYYHPFEAYGQLAPERLEPFFLLSNTAPLFIAATVEKDIPTDYDFMVRIMEKNKVSAKHNYFDQLTVQNPIQRTTLLGDFSIHFDAKKLATFLAEIGKTRGINRVDGKVSSYTQTDNGDVDSIILSSKESIPTDFIFDCSGFSRFFPKNFNTPWHSDSKSLTVNSAMPFFIDIDPKNIPSYTEAIAMSSGWIWKIPLQHRYGCGYVYDSNHISDENAKKEIIEWLGYEPEWPKDTPFKFEAGYYTEPWKHNVISLGLSAAFIEPLEATSIWTSMMCLANALGSPDTLYRMDPKIAEDYNRYSTSLHEQVSSFVYFHYMGERKDTNFWKHYTKENAPERLKTFIDIIECRVPMYKDFFGEASWKIYNWMYIALGTRQKELINNLQEFDKNNVISPFYIEKYKNFKWLISSSADNEALEHHKFLNILTGKAE